MVSQLVTYLPHKQENLSSIPNPQSKARPAGRSSVAEFALSVLRRQRPLELAHEPAYLNHEFLANEVDIISKNKQLGVGA